MEISGYKIIRQIGKGGMAAVYLAIQESLDRQVALKVMQSTRAKDEDFTERFLKEGRIIAQFQHPQIITIYDFGSHDSCHYFSMEYLPKGTLAQQIEQGLDLERALDIIKSLAGALAYAHKRGVIHRDIKPQNILFRQDDTPVLSDFGIAKIIDADTQLTAPGLAIGSPTYMSPEQVTGQKLDGRSDLYSLGIVFYEMLTGQPPYQADDMVSTAMMHCTQPVPQLPAGFVQLQPVLQKLLAKKPANRFDSAEQFIQELDQPRTKSSFYSLSNKIRMMQSFKAPLRSKKSLWTGGLLLSMLAVGGVIYLNFFYQPAPSDAEPGTFELPLAPENRSAITINYEQLAIRHFQSGEFEQSLELIKLGLNTSPNDVRLLALRKQVQPYQDASRLLEQAQRRSEEGEIEHSLRLVEEGLRHVPDESRLIALRDTLWRQIQQRQQQADQRLFQAHARWREGDLEGSLKLIEQGLQQVANYPQLLVLRDEVKMALETNNRIAQLLRDCTARFPIDRQFAEKGGEVRTCYQQIITLAPDNREAHAKLEQWANHYVDWTSDAIRQADFHRAGNYLAQLGLIKPDHPQLASLSQALQAKREQAAAETSKKIESKTERQTPVTTKRQPPEERSSARSLAKPDVRSRPATSAITSPGIVQPFKPSKPAPELSRRPEPRKPRSTRCSEMLLRAQLGEPLSTTELEECKR